MLATRVAFGVIPTDYATITRGFIESAQGYTYSPTITDMHFGKGERCILPDRSRWSPDRRESALVWCYRGHCIAVPKICNNVSRVWVQNPREPRDPPPRGESWGNPNTVPEPSTAVLIGLALLVAGFFTNRRL